MLKVATIVSGYAAVRRLASTGEGVVR